MKKFINILLVMFILLSLAFSGTVFADTLSSFNVEVDKTNVKPNEEVTVKVNFGAELGAYTVTIDYDDDVFDLVSVDGGNESNIDGKVKVVYADSHGGANTRNSMSVKFKAKANIVASNPTEFAVTANGMSSGDTRTTYDNITSGHVKQVIVEPDYKDYVLNLQYDGTITAGVAKDMLISFTTEMGRNYKQARLVAEAKTPEGATISLVGTDIDGTEYDIIKNGWGNPQGYEIGGPNVVSNLNFKGTFSQDGEYAITLKLVDRLNSDSVIAEETFNVRVGEIMPTQLPKTGINVYIPLSIILLFTLGISVFYNKKH